MSDNFKKMKETKEPTQAQVFEMLGRLLYVCNVIELRLRWMYKHRGGIWTGKTPKELIKAMSKAVDKQQKENKSPLGAVGRKIFDAIYTPRCNKDIKAAEEKNFFVCKIDIKVDWKGRRRRAVAKFDKFIETRNYLVHGFAGTYDLTNTEQCQQAYDDLKKKIEIIKDAEEFFDEDFRRMRELLLQCRDEMLKSLEKKMNEKLAHQRDGRRSITPTSQP
jgi:hypothetical protein